jgi:hypothetical protein
MVPVISLKMKLSDKTPLKQSINDVNKTAFADGSYGSRI